MDGLLTGKSNKKKMNYSKETWTEKKNIFEDFVFTTEKKVLRKEISKRSAIPLLG